MSLLMKALANAEENKRVLNQQARHEDHEQQQAAANIFSASQQSNTSFSMLVNGLIVLIIIGIFWFSYKLYQLNQIPTNLAISALPIKPPVAQGHLQITSDTGNIALKSAPPKPNLSKPVVSSNKQVASSANKVAHTTPKRTEIKKIEVIKPEHTAVDLAQTPASSGNIGAFADTEILKSSSETTSMLTNDQPTGPKQIQVAHKAGDLVIDQRLQDAYQAFVSNNPKKAKSLYRSVLEQDIYQTDALLGMAAIAQKEGRYADAAGWYKKTLSTDPNNPVALAGLAATNPSQNALSHEQRLKKLISKQPYHAQHYANLGNLYASKQAWTKAQAAFFEANRHDKNNAQFAFNLAVSLEHLGKPSLAAQHYQRALTLVKEQNLTVPDSTQIQQRLDVLQ